LGDTHHLSSVNPHCLYLKATRGLQDVDAEIGTGARLGLAMCGKGSANMKKCGVPMHSFRKWAVRFACLGISVGRVDQVRA